MACVCHQIDDILSAVPTKGVQRAMFSATMPQGIEDLVMAVLRDPVRVTVGTSGAGKCPLNPNSE